MKRVLSLLCAVELLLNFTIVVSFADASKQFDYSSLPQMITKAEATSNKFAERMTDEEDEYSVVFRNSSGERTVYYYNTPIKYRDETGSLRDKNTKTAIVPVGSKELSNYLYKNETNTAKSYYPKQLCSETPIIIALNDFSVELAPIYLEEVLDGSKNPGENELPKVSLSSCEESESISYSGAFGDNTELKYQITFSGVKEDIVLYENTGTNIFKFNLNLHGLFPKENNGGYELIDPKTEMTVARIPAVVVNDSSDNKHFTYNNSMKFEQGPGNDYVLTITVDEGFLRAESTRYPVYIDPSIITPSSIISDTTLLYGSSYDCAGSSALIVGNVSALGASYSGLGRSVFKFHRIALDFRYNWEDVSVSTVELHVHGYNTTPTGDYIDSYMVTSSTSNYLTGVTGQTHWNAYYMFPMSSQAIETDGRSRDGTGAGDWYSFNISNAFLTWLEGYYGGILNHYGIMLKARDETNSVAFFDSTECASAENMPFLKLKFTITGEETEGIYSNANYKIVNADCGLMLHTSSLADNSIAQLGTPSNDTYSDFILVYEGNNEYSIHSADNMYKVLSVGEAIEDGYASRQVGLYHNYNSPLQRWYIVLGDRSNEQGDTLDTETYYFISKQYPELMLSFEEDSTTDYIVYASQNGEGSHWHINLDIRLNVAPHTQQSSNSCGAASCKMIIDYLSGRNINESSFFNAAANIGNNSGTPLLYAYVKEMNYELCGIRAVDSYYRYRTSANILLPKDAYPTVFDYEAFLVRNLSLGKPLLTLISISSSQTATAYAFGYQTSGHYIVITGISRDNIGNITVFYNDPHYNYAIAQSPQRSVNISEMHDALSRWFTFYVE